MGLYLVPDLLLKNHSARLCLSRLVRRCPALDAVVALGTLLTSQVGFMKCETLKCEMESTCYEDPTMAGLPGVDLGTPAGALQSSLWPLLESEARASWTPKLHCLRSEESPSQPALPRTESFCHGPYVRATQESSVLTSAQCNVQKPAGSTAFTVSLPRRAYTGVLVGAGGQGRPFPSAPTVKPWKDGIV